MKPLPFMIVAVVGGGFLGGMTGWLLWPSLEWATLVLVALVTGIWDHFMATFVTIKGEKR